MEHVLFCCSVYFSRMSCLQEIRFKYKFNNTENVVLYFWKFKNLAFGVIMSWSGWVGKLAGRFGLDITAVISFSLDMYPGI